MTLKNRLLFFSLALLFSCANYRIPEDVYPQPACPNSKTIQLQLSPLLDFQSEGHVK